MSTPLDTSNSNAVAPSPVVWAVIGRRAGDRGQILQLARALGLPYEEKQLAFNRIPHLPNWITGTRTWTLDRNRSSPLVPPWPDLIIASGKRSVPLVRWIRRQSGGKTRLVHIGRPRASLREFDLIITTPQYRLPERPNVMQLVLPLNRPDPIAVAHAVGRWSKAPLPRPLTGLLVGGDSKPYFLTAEAARRLGEEASRSARDAGGSLLVTTSPRTSTEATDALFDAISGPAELYRWRPADDNNPYLTYLGMADRFIVTAESASLIAEACCMGRPVELFPLPGKSNTPVGKSGGAQLSGLRAWLTAAGWTAPRRRLDALHDAVVARGLATWCGQEVTAPRVEQHRLDDELSSVAQRVRGLLGLPPADQVEHRGKEVQSGHASPAKKPEDRADR